MKSAIISSLLGLLVGNTLASPILEPRARNVPPYEQQFLDIMNKFKGGQLSDPDAEAQIASLLQSTKPSSTPKNAQDLQDAFKRAWETKQNDQQYFVNGSLWMLDAGASPIDGLGNYLPTGPVCPGINCDMNSNPAPKCNIYPKKSASDAPYDIPEEKLRQAIYIPDGFQYGRTGKQPILLVPGTASFGGINYQNNVAKLIGQSDNAEAFWLNVPGAMLDDIQNNAEYVAYAINYMQCQSGRSITVAGWSQASIVSQWALKYWPSTRASTSDMVTYSGDYHGTLNAYLLCGGFPCPPSVLQQEYNSKFVNALRANGGDSAYVPTTNIYTSVFDEIVEPQQDPFASASIKDSRGVGVTNQAVQLACPGQVGGSLFGHAQVLTSGVGAALFADAVKNPGPGKLNRIDKQKACQNYFADGLTIEDSLFTSGLIPLAGFYLFTYPEKSNTEPPLKAYAA